jgi:lipopolysaccharide export system permease protein
MQILSRLIIKEWFKTLIGAVSVLFLLISTADLINGFLQGKEASRVFLEYSLKMPDLMGKMFPISCLVASLFSLNRLKSHSELIAMLAGGFSYFKFYFIIGACAFFMVIVQFVNLGHLEPAANKIKRLEIQKSRFSEGRYLTRSSLEGGRFWYKSKNYFSSFAFYDKKNKVIRDLNVFFYTPDYRSSRIIKAKKAIYIGNGQWKLIGLNELSNLSDSTFPLQLEKPNLILTLSENPEDLGEFEADLTTLSFFKLFNFISKLRKSGINVQEYEVILLNKVFLSLVCLVFALLPVSGIFNPNRRNSSFGKNVIQTLLTTVIFWVGYSSILALGINGRIPPIAATASIPLLFLSYVFYTYFKNRKLSI